MRVCVAPTHLLWNATLGGHAWVFLNWTLGLQARGCQIIILEKLRFADEPERLLQRLRAFHERMQGLGLEARVALIQSPRDQAKLGDVRTELSKLTIPLDQATEEADLLLNFRYSIGEEIVGRFKRTALVDIDPGLLQLWISGGYVRPAPHDIWFSIGETVGKPGAKFSDCGVRWHFTPPPVYLPAWPVTKAPSSGPYTTVTNWWGEYEVDKGEMINNEKRTEFLEYLDLPSRTHAPLELAIYHEEGRCSDMPLMREHGWSARPASEVSDTPQAYRKYIQDSRGEFSCAKRSCMHFANAWISDRTLCYLASGRPAVVQHTGVSSFLPDAEGLFRFRGTEEAARYLDLVESDHEHQSGLARELAERYFDAEKVAARVIDMAMSVPARGKTIDASS
jgi:hypothetical protein